MTGSVCPTLGTLLSEGVVRLLLCSSESVCARPSLCPFGSRHWHFDWKIEWCISDAHLSLILKAAASQRAALGVLGASPD